MREHVDGDFPFANDFNAITQALADDAAVVSGCSVGAGGTDDMTVSVRSGSVRINGSKVTVNSQSVTLSGADISNDRYDLVVVDTDGTAEAVNGTASSTPNAPSIPVDHVLLAIVAVPAGTSSVMDNEIFDARVVFTPTFDHQYRMSDNGVVTPGDLRFVGVVEVASGETFEIRRATFLDQSGPSAPASGADLVLATESTSLTTLLSGDGSTEYVDEPTPGNYTNTSGTTQQILVGIDNGHYNTGTGSRQSLHAAVYGRVY